MISGSKTYEPRWRASWIASLDPASRREFVASLSLEELQAYLFDWGAWARPNQTAPDGLWSTWLVLAGRGFGKTRAGGEWIRGLAESNTYRRLGLIAATAADARDIMVEGESGILAISPPWFKPHYQPSKRRVVWPNGCMAFLYSADEPDRLRGPQHEAIWADELAAWRYPEAWDMALFGLRLGDDPRAVVTTTPRPTKELKALIADPHTVITKGSTYENRANLAPTFFDTIVAKYEGTRLGRQELMAEILDDNPNALWKRGQIEDDRVGSVPDLIRVVVAVDPSVDENGAGAECGIVVVGLGSDRHGYVLEDRSLHASPAGWALEVAAAYNGRKADHVVAEQNNGGALVAVNIRTVDGRIPVKLITASRGKITRAEPIASLYEQHRVHHVGRFSKLEDQLAEWEPGQDSPDRMDALVWGLSELMLDKPVRRTARSYQG